MSIETSKALPGAEIHQGPVLRVGDRSTVFPSDFSIAMWELAQKCQKKNSGFKFQRRLLEGGSCEATALSLYGYKASGLSIPLLNYHNMGLKRVAAEKVSLLDLEMARFFCSEMVRAFPFKTCQSTKLKKILDLNHERFTFQLKTMAW